MLRKILRFGIAAFIAVALVALALAAGFTFNIGNPVASRDFVFKAAAFVFRTEGCTDSAKRQIGGAAEGLVNGVRRSVALKMAETSKPGVYAVSRNWPGEGAWVVVLKGTCADASAGAIVPIGPHGFIRDSAKFFPRTATKAEIERSLEELAKGDTK
jgi:hypothetical protein